MRQIPFDVPSLPELRLLVNRRLDGDEACANDRDRARLRQRYRLLMYYLATEPLEHYHALAIPAGMPRLQQANEHGLQIVQEDFGAFIWALANELHKWGGLYMQPEAGEPDLSHPVLLASFGTMLAQRFWDEFVAEAPGDG